MLTSPAATVIHVPDLTLPVISCGLDPNSLSRKLAKTSAEILGEAGHVSEVIDLAEIRLPAFDDNTAFHAPEFDVIHEAIRASDGVVLAFPIYNWGPSGHLKYLIETTGATGDGVHFSAWFDKVVTFVCAAGLPHSYMATGSLAHSLMLDFKCIINPYTAYVSGRDWQADELTPDRLSYMEKTLHVHAELAQLLSARRYRSDWQV